MAVHIIPLPAERFEAWQSATRARLIRLRQESGLRPGVEGEQHAEAFLAEFLPDGYESPTARLFVAIDDGAEIATIWLAVAGERAFIVDLAFVGEPTDEQLQQLPQLIREVARAEKALTVSIALFWQDAAGWRFVAGHGFAPSSIQMVLHPLPEREATNLIRLEPMGQERFIDFIAASEADFANELAATGRMTPADAAQESRRQMERELPEGLSTPAQLLYVAVVDGEEVGILWMGIRSRDDLDHAFILNVEVNAGHRRKGYGRAIMQAAEVEARRAGAESIGLHVFGVNQAAVTLYEQLGYRRLEELLVMEL